VLQSSNLFDKLAQGIASPSKYTILEKDYDTSYYLTNGIHLKYFTIVQIISQSTLQSCKKDIEKMWTFGVVQARFLIIKGPARYWDERVLHGIMTSCVILHNIIEEVECEGKPDNIDSTQLSIAEEMEDDDTERF